VLTVDAPPDHPWHHGLWSTIKYLNGENFWEEFGEFGLLATVDVTGSGNRLDATIEWRRPGAGDPAARERRTLAHVPLCDRAYAIDWTFRIVPAVDTDFDRTPFTTWGGYGGLTLRGAPDWSDTVVRLPARTDGDRTLGVRAPWCALVSAEASVAILDHPGNVRFPTQWYASTRAATYGDGWANFCNAAFLWDGVLRVPAGGVLVRHHRVIVADGALDHQTLASWHDAWAREERPA
jgi:hypothetical protein